MSNWISVEDRLPEESGRYLVYISYDWMPRIDVVDFALNLEEVDGYHFLAVERPGWYALDGEYGYYEIDHVTHWMPLPEAPKAD